MILMMSLIFTPMQWKNRLKGVNLYYYYRNLLFKIGPVNIKTLDYIFSANTTLVAGDPVADVHH